MTVQNDDQKKPDIIITDEDLMNVEPMSERIFDFFNQPVPDPPKPTAIVEVKCKTARRLLYVIMEQTGSDSWKIQTAIDDSNKQYISSNRSLGRTAKDVIRGNLDWSAYRCPYCGGTGVIRCGRCNKITCDKTGGKQGDHFKCEWCGNKGTIQGYFDSVDATRGKGKK